MHVLHGLTAALLGAALGVQVFLSFGVARAAFRLLDRPQAARLMEGLLPGYYGVGLALAAGAAVAALALAGRARRAPLRWGVAGLLAISVAGTLYAGQVLLPQVRAARVRAQAAVAGDLAPLEFSRLHRRSVSVNLGLLGTGALALALHLAARPR